MTVQRVANIMAVSGAATVLWTAVALAGPFDGVCTAEKLNAAVKYEACRVGALKKALPDYTKCDAKYTAAWAKAESNKNSFTCTTVGDQGIVQTEVTEFTTCLYGELRGTSTAPCAPGGGAQPLQTGQTSSYGTGSDGNLQKGAARSYTDNGDGTITDNETGLMWEKKDQAAGIHNFVNSYTWCGASCYGTNIMDGTISTTFLATLNGGSGFAGHTDLADSK